MPIIQGYRRPSLTLIAKPKQMTNYARDIRGTLPHAQRNMRV